MLRVIIFAGSLLAASACTTNSDCQLNGECTNSQCACDSEWHGDDCGKLSIGIGAVAYGPPNTTAWGGGPPVFDSIKKEWVLYVTEMANHCGLSVWQHQSHIVKAVSAQPSGPYTHEKVVVPTQAHNPCYIQDPVTKTHLIYHIGGGDNPETPAHPFLNCTNGTTPNSTTPSPLTTATPGPLYSSQPYVHASSSLDGPFERLNFSLPAGHTPDVAWVGRR
jgi:hypothetical protein